MREEREPVVLALKKTVLADNDADAEKLRGELKEKGLFLCNVMSSPGAGKTTLILALAKELSRRGYPVGVMEADIDGDIDARRILSAGFPAVQLHTGGMCHLDASMTRQGLSALGTEGLRLVFLENVGNLVCPAEFDTGASCNMVLLSVPEGDDKPLKYPLMFQKADIAVVTKTDTLPAFPFRTDLFGGAMEQVNPRARICSVSAATGEGVDTLAGVFSERMERAWLSR